MEFMREFPDDATCLEWLWRNRHSKDGRHARCVKCTKRREFKRYDTTQQRQSWTCVACGYHLHPTAGTIFHKSSTSLHLWFYAIYLMTSTRCGISAKQIERELGVTYKTAWRMCHEIRHILMRDDTDGPFSGRVEADEVYIGGRRRGVRTGRPGADSHKVPVFGIVERGKRTGRVMAVTVPNVSQASLMPHIIKRVLPSSTIYTDEYTSYRDLRKQGYDHRRIRHAEKVYVSGDIHTNTIEGFWSLPLCQYE
jgi:transposase-like protein